MAATSTYRQILIELVERYGLGWVIPVSSNTATAFTLTTAGSPELRGPFSGAKIPVGSGVICSVETSGTSALGHRTYVSNWVASTGVLTVSPAIGDTDVTEIIVLRPEIGDPDRVLEAVNRALLDACKRWQLLPLTFVPDGDMLGGTVTDYWTASAGTASYQSLGVPELVSRVVQISHSSTATLTSNTIPARANEVWEFETAIRATTDGDTAALVIRDVVAGATITPSYTDGDGSTTSRSFVTQSGSFTVPGSADTDGRIAFRLDVSGSGTMTAQMAPIVAYPRDARTFPLQQHCRSQEFIGNFRTVVSGGGNSGPDERTYSEPLRRPLFNHIGDHRTVTLPVCGPVYYEELVFGRALSAMTDTTDFPLDYVVRWAYAKLTDNLMRREMAQAKRLENGQPLPSVWRPIRNSAIREARWSPYEPELVNVRS